MGLSQGNCYTPHSSFPLLFPTCGWLSTCGLDAFGIRQGEEKSSIEQILPHNAHLRGQWLPFWAPFDAVFDTSLHHVGHVTVGRFFLASKKTRNLQRAHFSLTHATPLLPVTTLSEGECRVSAG